MVAYNFQARFAPLIERGEKAVTIRDVGKRRHARKGEALQLYTGQRTTSCRKLLATDPVCTGVQPINFYGTAGVWLNGWMTESEIETLARLDGFEDGEAFLAFHQSPKGQVRHKLLIEWEPPRPAPAAEVAA